jgi:GMP synthase-like glutamine amidotransferase
MPRMNTATKKVPKDILIFRHAAHEGPGYLAYYLERRGLPYRLIRVDRHEAIPSSVDAAGLVFMGVTLIQQAVKADVPVLGHCLGGQLLAKALGGKVTRNRVKEIGWLPVDVVESPTARAWMDGLPPRFEVFHWHGETFSLPPGATPILSSRDCRNQAFVLGKHLGFQCHIEMTPTLVRSWARTGNHEIAQTSRTVQSERQMSVNLVARAGRLNRVADRFYDKWIQGWAK